MKNTELTNIIQKNIFVQHDGSFYYGFHDSIKDIKKDNIETQSKKILKIFYNFILSNFSDSVNEIKKSNISNSDKKIAVKNLLTDYMSISIKDIFTEEALKSNAYRFFDEVIKSNYDDKIYNALVDRVNQSVSDIYLQLSSSDRDLLEKKEKLVKNFSNFWHTKGQKLNFKNSHIEVVWCAMNYKIEDYVGYHFVKNYIDDSLVQKEVQKTLGKFLSLIDSSGIENMLPNLRQDMLKTTEHTKLIKQDNEILTILDNYRDLIKGNYINMFMNQSYKSNENIEQQQQAVQFEEEKKDLSGDISLDNDCC